MLQKISMVLCFCLMSFLANAQTKIGYTNPDVILHSIPHADTVEQKIAEYQKELQKEITSQEEVYKMKIEHFKQLQTQTPAPPQNVLQKKVQEIQQFESQLRELISQNEQKLETKKAELLAPVFKIIMKEIEEVSKAEEYTYVFNTNAGGLPIMIASNTKDNDITNKVIKALGGKEIDLNK